MQYDKISKEIDYVLKSETNRIANMANVSSLCYEHYNKAGKEVNWFGFYLVDKTKEKELVLGPFQGNVACTRIRYGKGVCGTCYEKEETIIVPNVHEFKGHIACDSRSESEIVVPVRDDEGNMVALIDVDALKQNTFNQDDQTFLQNVSMMLTKYSHWKTAI